MSFTLVTSAESGGSGNERPARPGIPESLITEN